MIFNPIGFRKQRTTHAGEKQFISGISAGLSCTIPGEDYEFFEMLNKSFLKFRNVVNGFLAEANDTEGADAQISTIRHVNRR